VRRAGCRRVLSRRAADANDRGQYCLIPHHRIMVEPIYRFIKEGGRRLQLLMKRRTVFDQKCRLHVQLLQLVPGLETMALCDVKLLHKFE